MFFKKKKDEKGAASGDKVFRPPRYASLAMVSINGFEGQAVLRNVSTGGFCMESKTFADMDVGASYEISVTPEKHTGINHLELTVEVRWILSSPEKFSVGFRVVQGNSHAFEKFEKYVDYLRERNQRRAS
ncbi:MAG: PilZ domain-containing protein [Treponema sp.]|nr:PilZ domain-containing protein [Treponema sp.]